MKKIVPILILTNALLGVLYWHARGQWKLYEKMIAVWEDRESRNFQLIDVLGATLINQVHKQEVESVFEKKGLSFYEKEGGIHSNNVSIYFDDKRLVRSVEVIKYQDK